MVRVPHQSPFFSRLRFIGCFSTVNHTAAAHRRARWEQHSLSIGRPGHMSFIAPRMGELLQICSVRANGRDHD